MTDKEFEEIKARNAARTPGKWYWRGNLKSKSVELVTPWKGTHLIMDFWRYGTQGAQPYFLNRAEGIIESFKTWVTPDHNHSFVGIDNPDAEFIARASEDIPALIAEIERLREENESLERVGGLFAHVGLKQFKKLQELEGK
jgi:hypothetical protein